MAEIITIFICLIGAVYVYWRERRSESVKDYMIKRMVK